MSEIDEAWHYPPELVSLLIDAVPRLVKGKLDQINVFRGAGVAERHVSDVAARVAADKKAVGRHNIAREVIQRMNEDDTAAGLRARRELLKRVTEWEDFGSCWPDDRDVAYARVAEIKKIVDVKDSFTKMKIVAERERQKNMDAAEARARELQAREREFEQIKSDLFALFASSVNPWKRGKELEKVLTRLFQLHQISIREPFVVRGDEGKGIVEQIDGVIAFDGKLYLVELKWLAEPVGRPEVGYFASKVMVRAEASGVFIAHPGFTSPAVDCAKEFLAHRVVVLVEIEEIVRLLTQRGDLVDFLKRKLVGAVVDKNPFVRPLI